MDHGTLDHRYESARFVAGEGCVSRLGELVDEAAAERVMLVCGRSTGRTEALIEPIVSSLGARHVGTFDGARPNTPLEMVRRGIRRKQELEADALVSVGGGSNHDTAAAIAALDAEDDRTLHDLKATTSSDGERHVPEMPAPKPPIFAVSTTLSAAEVTSAFGCTDEDRGEKAVCVDERIRPEACFYDPALTRTTPGELLAGSAMNAFDHAVETLYSERTGDNPFYQATAEKAITLLTENVVQAASDPADLSAICRAQVGAAMSGLGALEGACVNHAINHNLCARHPVAHGDGNSILLPHGLRFNFEAVPTRVLRVSRAMGLDVDAMDDEAALEATLSEIRSLQHELGVPTRLRDIDGVDRDDFEALAEIDVSDPTMSNNPRPVTPADVVALLEAAW